MGTFFEGDSPNRDIQEAIAIASQEGGDSVQNVNIVDALCEGPINGLVNGEAGVYLNDVPAEYDEFRSFIPLQMDPSSTDKIGTITFSGTTTGTLDSNTTIPSDLENNNAAPRLLILAYFVQEVTVDNLAQTTNEGKTYELLASSGTPFTAGSPSEWDSSKNEKDTRADIFREGEQYIGRTSYNSTSSIFITFKTGNGDGIEIGGTYKLRIYKFIPIVSIDSQAGEVVVETAPASGTYNFGISKQPTLEEIDEANTEGRGNIAQKIDGLKVRLRTGTLTQDPLSEIGGVGGSAAIPGNLGSVVLPQLKIINPDTNANTTGITPIDAGGMPTDSSDFNDAATTMSSAAFGLTSPAQVQEVDEISWSIRYNALQAISLVSGTKETAHAWYVMQIAFQKDNVFGEWFDCFPRKGKYVKHKANTSAPTQFDHVLSLEQFRPFEDFKVRIIRVTRHLGLPVRENGDSGGETTRADWQLSASAAISSLGSVIKDKFRYPYTALASLSFNSRQFQRTPKRSYLTEGLLVRIPSNYTPREYAADGVARYDGFWDGDFREALYYTDNPAWIFYDIVRNNRYGAGKWIQATDIDKYALYRVARYCDELVDDGAGGTEPRFRANIYLAKATDVYKVLKDMATIFLGILYWQDGQLTAVQDTPQDPVYTFSKGNVIDGSFNYETSGNRTKINQVVVTWNDPTINYEPVPLIVEDRQAIARTGKIISEAAVAFGATSEAQAFRYGKWKLWTAQNQTEVVSFRTALSSMYIKPGDVIAIQDANRTGLSHSGRIKSVSVNAPNTTITFDREVTYGQGIYDLNVLFTEPAALWTGVDPIAIQNGGTYQSGERVAQAWVDEDEDGTPTLVDLNTEERASSAFQDQSMTIPLALEWKDYTYVQTIENISPGSSVTTDSLTIPTADLDGTPVANTIWALTKTVDGLNIAGSSKNYKVLSITQETVSEASITAVEFYNEKFIAVEKDYELGTLPGTIFDPKEPESIPPVENLRLLINSDPAETGEEFILEWDAPSDAQYIAKYVVNHNIDGIENPIKTSDTSLLLTKVPNGILQVKVRAISAKNNYSRPKFLEFYVDDPYKANVTRVQEGIPKGIVSTSKFFINGDSEALFELDPAIVVSLGDSFSSSRQITEADKIDLLGITSTSGVEYFVLLDGSNLRLMYYDSEALDGLPLWREIPSGQNYLTPVPANWVTLSGTVSVASDNNTVVGVGTSFSSQVRPRDIITFGSSKDLAPYSITSVNKSQTNVRVSFSSPLSGVFADGERVFIKGTLGSTELNNNYYFVDKISETVNGSVYDYTVELHTTSSLNAPILSADITNWTSSGIIRAKPFSAVVIGVVNDTTLILDRAFDTAIPSGTNLNRRLYRPSYVEDSIFARILYDGSEFKLTKYITLDETLALGKSVVVTVSDPLLQYEFNSPNAQLTNPGAITASATAIGFRDPVFKVTSVGGLDGSIDTDYQDPDVAGQFTYTKTVDSDGTVAYSSGAPEIITIEAAERFNTTLSIEGEGIISKVTAGSDGLSGKTVFLESEDYTVVYDEAGANPQYNDTIGATNTLTFTATDQNFTNAVYRFTFTGGTGSTPGDFTLSGFGTFSGTNTATVQIPTGHDSWNSDKKTGSFTVEVDVAESGDTGTILASDTVTVQGIHALKGGYWVSLSNEAHTIPTTATGVPVGTAGVTANTVVGENSGTTIEVGKGADILTYSATPGLGQFSVSAAETPTSALEIGSSTPSNGDSLVTYGDHEFSDNGGWSTDTASIAYTINLEGSGDTVVRRQTFTKSKQGFAGITVTNSNPVQALPADKAGNVLAYTNSGTNINVLLSGDSIPYYPDAATATTAGVTTYWNVASINDIEISVGSPATIADGSLGPITYGNHSSFTQGQANASIEYTLEVVLDGVTEQISTTQFFSKNTNGTAVFITATSTHLNFDEDELNPSPSDYTLNWSAIVPSELTNYAYRLLENGGNAQNFANNVTSEGPLTKTYANLPITYEIQLYSDNTYTDLLASDKVTVNKSKDGAASTVPGSSGAAVNLAFIRKATTPTVGTGTGALPDGESGGWSDSVPTGTNTLWATKGNRAQGATQWSWQQTPYRVDGTSAAEIYFYSDATTGSDPSFTAPTYNFTNNSTNSTPANWNLSPPTLTAPNQKIYVIVVLYAGTPGDTAASAQTTSSAVIYAQRIDGGSVNIVFVRVPSGVTPTATTDGTSDFPSDFTDGSTYSWSDSPPAGNNFLWAVKGTENSTTNVWTWGSPYRLDGNLAVELYVYQKQSGGSAVVSNPPGDTSYNFTTGVWSAPTDWQKGVPSITADDDIIYQSYAVGTGGPTTTNANLDWSSATVYARRVDGQDSTVPGPDGLRTIQGYLYYEKTSAGSPNAPAGNTYTFSTGAVTGTDIGTGTNTWTNSPRPQDPTSSNTHYTIRYYGTEASAGSSTIAVSYSGVVQYTNFTGVVTFSNGTFSNGSTLLDDSTQTITSIDGGNIYTGSIVAEAMQIGTKGLSTDRMLLLDDSLKIFEGTTLRVHLGDLSNSQT